MAKSGTFPVSVTWPGGTAEIRWRTSTNSASNFSRMYLELWAHTSGFTSYGNGTWQMRIGSDATVNVPGVSISGSWVKVAERIADVTHNADGSKSIQIGVSSGYVSGTSWTATSGLQTVALDDFSRVPTAVAGRATSNVTPTGAVATWSQPTTPLPILEYQVRLRRMTDNVDVTYSAGTNRTFTFASLLPGTNYGWVARARNADGWGPWSSTYATFTTLPSTPPTLSVNPAPTGTSATITLAPPSGITGVDSYTVTRTHTAPPPIPNPASQSYTTTSNSLIVTGLTPGATYQWTATAKIGNYTTPISSPVSATQPKPSTAPGDFFDGNTPAGDDVTYAWTGTVNNSTSTATGVGVTGWTISSTVPAGTATLQRVTGGYAATHAAFLSILLDTTDAVRTGQANAAGQRTDVAEGAMYVGSMYVMPSRNVTLYGVLVWIDAAGLIIGSSLGNATAVSPGVWTRVIVADVAPAGAEFAAIRVENADTSGNPWRGGDTLRMDAAMITLGAVYPYFDGDTPDTVEYTYDWEGTANASISERTALTRTYDPLNDPDCVDVPPSPRPPTVPSDCIDDVGLWRRYWAYVPAEAVADWLVTVPTLVINTLSQAERQVRVRWYQDPFNRGTDDIEPSDYCSEQIISYIPPRTAFTLDGVTERVWAEVEGGAPRNADHLLYGTGGTPAEWPHLSCGIGYWVSFDVPATNPAGNIQVRALLTQRAA